MVQPTTGLVVERQGLGRHPVSPLLVHSIVAGQIPHRALANSALKSKTIAEQVVAQHPVHDQALPQGPITDHQFPGLEHPHRGLENQGPRHNDFGPSLVDRREGAPLFRRHAQELGDQLVNPLAAEAIALQFQR